MGATRSASRQPYNCKPMPSSEHVFDRRRQFVARAENDFGANRRESFDDWPVKIRVVLREFQHIGGAGAVFLSQMPRG